MFVQSSVLDRYQIGGISDSSDKQTLCQGYIIRSVFGSIRFKVRVSTSGISEPRLGIRAGLEFVRPDLESDFKLDFWNWDYVIYEGDRSTKMDKVNLINSR